MPPLLAPYFESFTFSGNLPQDVTAVFRHYQLPIVAGHVSRVAQEAGRLAAIYGADATLAETAGWLHDIGGVIPPKARVDLCRALQINVFPGEAQFPQILHQKLSVAIAREIFGVGETTVLSAVGCHTTLKAGASLLDKILFVADKIKWDQPGEPPYLAEIETAVRQSIDAACQVYLTYLWGQRETLGVIHPWFVAAYEELCAA